MFISTEGPVWAGHTGDGATTAFGFPYPLLEGDDLKVYLDGVQQTSGFTTSVAADLLSATVTFTVAPASGVKVRLRRFTDDVQPTDYTNNDAFPAEAHENALARRTLASQEHELGRISAVRAPNFEPELNMKLPAVADRGGLVMGFDAAGLPRTAGSHDLLVALLAGSTPLIAQQMTVFDTIAGLTTLNSTALTDGHCALALGYYAYGDGGGGPAYRWVAASTKTVDGGAVLAAADTPSVGRWEKMLTGLIGVSAKWWGCKIDGATDGTGTDDTTAFRNAIAWIEDNGLYQKLYLPRSTGGLLISDTIQIRKWAHIEGAAAQNCTIQLSSTWAGAAGFPALDFDGIDSSNRVEGVKLKGITIQGVVGGLSWDNAVGLRLDYYTHFEIEDVRIRRVRTGFYMTQSWNLMTKRFRVHDVKQHGGQFDTNMNAVTMLGGYINANGDAANNETYDGLQIIGSCSGIAWLGPNIEGDATTPRMRDAISVILATTEKLEGLTLIGGFAEKVGRNFLRLNPTDADSVRGVTLNGIPIKGSIGANDPLVAIYARRTVGLGVRNNVLVGYEDAFFDIDTTVKHGAIEDNWYDPLDFAGNTALAQGSIDPSMRVVGNHGLTDPHWYAFAHGAEQGFSVRIINNSGNMEGHFGAIGNVGSAGNGFARVPNASTTQADVPDTTEADSVGFNNSLKLLNAATNTIAVEVDFADTAGRANFNGQARIEYQSVSATPGLQVRAAVKQYAIGGTTTYWLVFEIFQADGSALALTTGNIANTEQISINFTGRLP